MLDELLGLGRIDSQVYAAVATDCEPIWASAYRVAEVAAAKEFVRQHEGALRAIEEDYRGILVTIRGDVNSWLT
jgi:hypothetical protein